MGWKSTGAGGTHTIASHSDTTATGAETETLTDGSNADALHTHAATVSVTAKATRESSVQNINDVTNTDVDWDTEKWDTDGIITLGSSTTDLTIQTASKYAVKAAVFFAGSGNGTKTQVSINLNDVSQVVHHEIAGGSAIAHGITVSVDLDLAVDDVITVNVRQESGAGMDIGNDVRTFCSVHSF